MKLGFEACWKVQRELDAAGIEYEVVTHPWNRDKRDEMVKLSGQKLFPVIELEDGSVYREESKDMAATIKAGGLAAVQAAASPPAS